MAKGTAEEAMGLVAADFRANRRRDPRHDQCRSVDLLMTLKLKEHSNDDPLEHWQRSLPPFFLRVACEKSSSFLEVAMSEKIVVAYFFAMRSSEFSICYGERETIVVRLDCIRFLRKDGMTTPHNDDDIFNAFSVRASFILTEKRRKNGAHNKREHR